MRGTAVALAVFLWAGSPAVAQVSVGVSMPGVSIGINMPMYPQLVRVPNYPVYYAPRLNTNFFFYDGMYWVYQNDEWYVSSWYNGPWALMSPQMVPLFVLRIPVRYYRNPPDYFRGWRSDAPPRWGDHWGDQWARQRSGWDRWDRRAIPAPAPLPVYQRQYSGDRYPQALAQQQALQSRNYRYQPRDAVVRQHFQQQVAPAPAPRVQQAAPVRAPDPQGRPALQVRPQPQVQPQRAQQQERQQQRVQRVQPPQQPQPVPPPQPARQPRAQQGAERVQPQARGANERPQQPAARAAAAAAEQAQRQGQGQGQGRAAGKAKGQQQERDDEGEGRRQGRK